MATVTRPQTLAELRETPWQSRTVKEELRQGMIRALEAGEELFPGIVGYEETVIPEVILAMLAGHDMLFLGEKGQAKSRLMRLMVRFLDEWTPYLDIPGSSVHEDPTAPITQEGRKLVKNTDPSEVTIGDDQLRTAATGVENETSMIVDYVVRRHCMERQLGFSFTGDDLQFEPTDRPDSGTKHVAIAGFPSRSGRNGPYVPDLLCPGLLDHLSDGLGRSFNRFRIQLA